MSKDGTLATIASTSAVDAMRQSSRGPLHDGSTKWHKRVVRTGLQVSISLVISALLLGAAALRNESGSGVSAKKAAVSWRWSDLAGLLFVLIAGVVKSLCERS